MLGVTRPILLDALDGACHRVYGSMPNMSWIFNRAGMPIYYALRALYAIEEPGRIVEPGWAWRRQTYVEPGDWSMP